MSTSIIPEMPKGKHAEELRKRGFQEIGRAMTISDEEARELGENYRVVPLFKDPFFIYLGGKANSTYAMDETGMFWKNANAFVDLSDLGFKRQSTPPDFDQELKVSVDRSDDEDPPPTRH